MPTQKLDIAHFKNETFKYSVANTSLGLTLYVTSHVMKVSFAEGRGATVHGSAELHLRNVDQVLCSKDFELLLNKYNECAELLEQKKYEEAKAAFLREDD
jgi:hypothetical protein